MLIQIGQQEYTVTSETISGLLSNIEQFALKEYEKLPEMMKLTLTASTRALLAFAELREQNPDKKAELRVPKHTEPTAHILQLLIGYIAKALPHVNIEVLSEPDSKNITDLAFKTAASVGASNQDIPTSASASQDPGQDGGPVLTNGNIGERKDDSGQTLGPTTSTIVPNA